MQQHQTTYQFSSLLSLPNGHHGAWVRSHVTSVKGAFVLVDVSSQKSICGPPLNN